MDTDLNNQSLTDNKHASQVINEDQLIEPVGDVTNTDMYNEMINGPLIHNRNSRAGELTNVNSNQQVDRSRVLNSSALNKSRSSVNAKNTRSTYVA